MNSEVLLVIQKILWPLGIAVIGYFLIRLINTLDRVDKSVTKLDKTVLKQETEQAAFRKVYERDQKTTEKRLNSHAGVLNCHDKEIATLKEKARRMKKE